MIILGYSGIGKTYLSSRYPNTADLEDYLFYESTQCHSINYDLMIRHIIDIGLKRNGIALAHPSLPLRMKLRELNIDYILVFPKLELKDEYLQRFKNRGSKPEFINNHSLTWEQRHTIFPNEKIIFLDSNQYLIDAIEKCKKIDEKMNINKDILIEKFNRELDIK